MAAIDERDELNRARPAEVDERVERRANRPARVEHVVDEQDQPVVERERDFGPPDDRLRPDGVAHQVVAVQRDVERAGRHVDAGKLPELRGEPLGDRHAAGADADAAPARSRPRLRSRISCAMRVRLRDTRSASITIAMEPRESRNGAAS